jgi:hypothetical protein
MTPQDREETRMMLSDILSGHIENLNGRLNVLERITNN